MSTTEWMTYIFKTNTVIPFLKRFKSCSKKRLLLKGHLRLSLAIFDIDLRVNTNTLTLNLNCIFLNPKVL